MVPESGPGYHDYYHYRPVLAAVMEEKLSQYLEVELKGVTVMRISIITMIMRDPLGGRGGSW